MEQIRQSLPSTESPCTNWKSERNLGHPEYIRCHWKTSLGREELRGEALSTGRTLLFKRAKVEPFHGFHLLLFLFFPLFCFSAS